MSFELQLTRNRQSCQATKTLPFLSISADGSGSVRMFAATTWSVWSATVFEALQLAPPFDDVKKKTLPKLPETGTTTVPLGRTSGWPPRPLALSAVVREVPHVRPPSLEVFISTRLPAPASSHWT